MTLQPKTLTVSELKKELSARGMPVDGIKSVLCARLEGWLLARREPQQVCCGPVAIISRGCRRRHSRRREGGFYIRDAGCTTQRSWVAIDTDGPDVYTVRHRHGPHPVGLIHAAGES
jgi:hypothetical protein